MQFSDKALREKMFELTSQGIIPSVLKAEMCIMPDVLLLTKAIETSKGMYSFNYPGLKIEVWNKNGWELT